MKPISMLPLAAVFAMAFTLAARGAALFTEPFPAAYGDGTLLGTGVTTGGWNTKWPHGNSAGAGSAVSMSAGALQYTGLQPLEEAVNHGLRISTASTRRLAAPFSAQSGDGTDVYLSFLIRVTAATPVARELIGFRNSTGGGNQAASVGISATRQLTLYKNSSNPSATHPVVLNQNQTYFVVMRLRFQAGNDEVAVWLNPATGQTDPANAGVTPATTTAGGDQSSALSLQLPSVTDTSGPLYLDEFRVTTTWAEATPAAAGPGAPVFTGIDHFPDGLVIRGTGGAAGGPFVLVSSPDPAAPPHQWNEVSAGNFDADGNFLLTNAVPPSLPRLFFRVRTGTAELPPTAPAITAHPANLTLFTGQSAVFSVTATGTPPLFYQWFFNTHTPLPGETNATLALAGVTTNHAGAYSVTVSNAHGVASSAAAVLAVTAPDAGAPDFREMGFAGAGFNLTGGEGGQVVTATTGAELRSYTDSNIRYVIYVSGTLHVSGMTPVRSHKTIIGLGANATLTGGGLSMNNASNVIIRNLSIRNASEDAIGITSGTSHIWIDHCTISDAVDGAIDITRGANNVTVSWCRFYFTNPADPRRFVSLIGAGDSHTEDAGRLHVTFHHNWWGALCRERMPSVRFGRAHIFNNYFNSPGNNYCVRIRLFAEGRIENNHFENVRNPWEVYLTTGTPGRVFASGNTLVNTSAVPGSDIIIPPGTDTVFTPPYSYTLLDAADVPAVVRQHAGAGRGPFAH